MTKHEVNKIRAMCPVHYFSEETPHQVIADMMSDYGCTLNEALLLFADNTEHARSLHYKTLAMWLQFNDDANIAGMKRWQIIDRTEVFAADERRGHAEIIFGLGDLSATFLYPEQLKEQLQLMVLHLFPDVSMQMVFVLKSGSAEEFITAEMLRELRSRGFNQYKPYDYKVVRVKNEILTEFSLYAHKFRQEVAAPDWKLASNKRNVLSTMTKTEQERYERSNAERLKTLKEQLNPDLAEPT